MKVHIISSAVVGVTGQLVIWSVWTFQVPKRMFSVVGVAR